MSSQIQGYFMEPATLTAAMIATLAFSKAIEKTAETLTASVLNKLNNLRKKIWQRFQGNQKLEQTLAKAQKEGSKADVDLISAYLQVAMDTDPKFAQDIQQLAEEINQEINIGKIEGRNVQNDGGEAFQSNDANAPTFQGGSGHSITINYNNPPS
jgi:adenosyl cobinamide kinase/adenosyl cobinamide phosphate guanylyltransferase